MSYDKVIDSVVLDSKLTAIANAIREKTLQTSLLTIDEMPASIRSISTGEGGSCKFYECHAVIEQSEGGVLVSGITGLYGYSDDEVNGLYTYGELTDCVATTGYTHEKGKMWIYKHPNYVFWLLTYSKQAPDPGTSIAYCRGDASANPWELTWELNGGGGSVVVEQAPPADASWSGYEWNRKEETKTEIDTTVEVTSFAISGSGVSGLDSTFTKSSDTYDDKPVYTNTSNMYCWYYAKKWCITTTIGNLGTVYAHSAATSPENPWDATTWYGTWLNENQLTNMVVTADFPTKEVTTIVYEKSTTITEGLSWTSVKPEIGKTYTEDVLVEIASLYQSEDNGGTEEPDVPSPDEPEEPEEPVEPEQPEASFGTYLQISGSTAVNEGLAGVYKLNESTVTDTDKEWINIKDDTKKVTGYWEEVDPATYWCVKGGSDNYSYDNWGESIMSYPWNADNSSFVWYYHAEPVSDFHVTPYVSDEEDPSTGGNGSDEPTINSFTITGASRSAVNGTYTKTSDTSSKTGRDAQYSMKSGDDEYLCYYNTTWKEWDIKRSGLETMYYATTTADNPWEVTTWLNAFNDEVDSSIKVAAEAGTSGGSSSAGDVLVVSGSYQSDEYGNYSPGAADGEYTLKDTSATGTERVWQNENKTFEFRYYEMGELWMLVHGNNGEYDHYTYSGDNGHNDPVNSDGSSVVWKLQGMDSNMKVVKK